MRRRALVLLLILALIAAGAAVRADEAKIGEPFVDFTLPGLDGNEYTLSDYQGTVIALTFWGWSCTSCKEVEMPALQTRVFERYSREQVMVFAISIDPEPDQARIDEMKAYQEENGIEFPILYNGLKAGFDYRVFTTPILFLIDKDGTLQYKEGPETFDDETAELLTGLVDELDVGYQVGKKALGLTLNDLDGNPVSLSDYAGSIVVLAFFGSKDIACEDMVTPLQTRVQDAYGDRVALLGVVMDVEPDAAALKDFQEANSLTFTLLMDGLRTAVYYGFILPGAVVIDADGIIRFRQESPLTEEFFGALEDLL